MDLILQIKKRERETVQKAVSFLVKKYNNE